MIMHSFFYFSITESRFWSRTIKTLYFVRKIPILQLYILNLYEEQSAGLDNSDPESDHIGYEFGGDDLEEVIKRTITSEGYHEINEKEFMRHVDELFPRWRELKFDKKRKEMYLPD